MQVRIVDANGVKGRKAVLLCDDDGVPLAGQVRSVLECETGETPLITCTFEIDGKAIRIADK